jgi:DNA-binding MarR family transcriptional regulator
MARQIKLNGRETAVIKAIGYGLGVSGVEISSRTQMAPEDLTDALNALLELGYVETATMLDRITEKHLATETFEVNPSYVADLKLAIRR